MPELPSNNGSSSSPPPLDEGYWASLLRDGEFAKGERGPESDSAPWDSLGRASDTGVSTTGGHNPPSGLDWKLAQETYQGDQTVELEAIGFNRGGLLVSWNSLRGFVPASQLVDFPVDVDDLKRRDKLACRVGEQINLRIIELAPEANRLILSERAAQVEPGKRGEVLLGLVPGDICRGVVTNLCDFGAFIDLGGIEGLIHISELSWGRVGHPRDVLESGQEVEVAVLSVDPDQERVALSLKRLQPDPWESVEERYHIGQIVEGIVTNVVDFGAFACIEEGLEGLIHVSELAEGQFLHPRNVVHEGERISACILNIDGKARRLGLSLRRMDDNGSTA
jgi:small subunit ribosomal protein S1